MNPLLAQNSIEAVGWTLLHSLWQSGIVAGVLALFLKTGTRSSRLNYAAACAALATTLFWAAWTLHSHFERPTPGLANQPVAGVWANGIDPVVVTATKLPPSPPFVADSILPAVVGIWVAGVLIMSLRLVLASRWISGLRRTATEWGNSKWQEKIQRWSRELGLRRRVALCTSALTEVPAAIGWLKPMILLPGAVITQLTPQQLEAVILHELMHIRRHDYLVNFFQSLCEILFFFNPATWWISRTIRLEREHCCDELVVEQSVGKVEYAKALLRLEELRLAEAGTLMLAANRGSLKARIARIIDGNRPRFAFPLWSSAACCLVLVATLLTFAWPSELHAEAKSERLFELRAVVPDGTVGADILPFKDKKLSLDPRVLLDGSQFAELELGEDPLTHRAQIDVRLTPEGAARFSRITRENIGRQIAIVIDNTVSSAPVVNEVITGGRFVISGDFSREEAGELIRKLRPKASAAAETISAPRWSPPAGTVPSSVLAEARTLQQYGKYKEALDRHLWYHTASRSEPGQGGVRLSFALSDWLKLGQVYPPALDELKRVRDETAGALRTKNPAIDSFTLFQEYASINQTLRAEDKTIEFFQWLDRDDPEVAKHVFNVARPSLIKAGEYELCGKYMNAASFNQIRRNFEGIKSVGSADARRLVEKRYKTETLSLIALLVINEEPAEAAKVANEAVVLWNDPDFQSRVDSALTGKLPEP